MSRQNDADISYLTKEKAISDVKASIHSLVEVVTLPYRQLIFESQICSARLFHSGCSSKNGVKPAGFHSIQHEETLRKTRSERESFHLKYYPTTKNRTSHYSPLSLNADVSKAMVRPAKTTLGGVTYFKAWI